VFFFVVGDFIAFWLCAFGRQAWRLGVGFLDLCWLRWGLVYTYSTALNTLSTTYIEPNYSFYLNHFGLCSVL